MKRQGSLKYTNNNTNVKHLCCSSQMKSVIEQSSSRKNGHKPQKYYFIGQMFK